MTFIELSEVLGNLGEFIGSIIVLATLIYLALQIKQSKELLEENRKIAMSQVYQARADARNVIHNQMADKSIASVIVKGSGNNWEELSETEKEQIRQIFHQWLIFSDNNLYQNSLGLAGGLEAWGDEFQGMYALNTLVSMCNRIDIPIPPRIKSWYEQHKDD